MKKPLMSPKKYIVQKVRNFPFHEALVQESYYGEEGIATVLLSRKEPSGKITLAIFLVDTFCLGIKNASYKCHLYQEEYEELKEQAFGGYGYRKEDLVFVHNLIYGALDFAEDIGFKPHSDFAVAEYVLDPERVDEGINEIEFGKDGKPFFIAGPYDNISRIIKTLERNVGTGNFDVVSHLE
jgi:hypothetical protein